MQKRRGSCRGVYNFLLHFHMMLDGLEGLIADDMLHTAGIGHGGFPVHAQACQQIRQNRVALIDFGADRPAGRRQGKASRTVYRQIPVFAQQSDGTADARF